MNNTNDKIPLFKKWGHWYFFLVAFLVLLIILFSLFTKKYS